ncbi:hypothetical protein COHA_008323 [Chlorella ohadii]|uniref:SAM domain-containing protein n=1 Tax=Chlorella ohadii TaxID=2649997 RepID=A0AAD5DGY0_9CHLO|nr:hypothetical protein COHA_008323 [Chlorella ohadii]
MAAANAPVAAAFCPHCGCFLADLGSTQQQAQHTAACGAAAAARASPAARSQQQRSQHPQQQQQQQTPSGLVPDPRDQEQLGAAEGEGSLVAPDGEEGGEEEEDGNWSEQEEATQAAADGDGLAAAAAAEVAGSEEDGWEGAADGAAAEQSSPGSGGGSTDDDDEEEQAAGAGERAALRAWLAQHGVEKYADHFERAGAGLSLLPCLTDADLQQMGIAALGARKKLLLAAEELADAVEAAAGGEQGAAEGQQWAQQQEPGTEAGAAAVAAAGHHYSQLLQEHAAAAAAEDERRRSHAAAGPSGVGDWRSLVAGGGGAVVTSILNYFKPTGGGKPSKQAAANPGSILSYLKAPDGSSLPVPPPAAQRPAGGGGRGSGKAGQKQWAHKQAMECKPNSPYRHWFLTHFHADHYKGLNGKFDRGTLYCSPPTALLVQQQLRVKPGCIRTVQLNSPILVEGVRVTFLDANHCPGAVMILFEPPGRRPVLHTGDCRLVADMQQEAVLQAVRQAVALAAADAAGVLRQPGGKADLILDTTYCSPEYAFPSQQEVLKFAIDAVKAEAFNPKTLFLFGSYTIGKERLFLEAARVLQRKIYVSVAKRKILDCLNLPPEYRSLLTTDDHETNLHAVPLWMVSQKHMAKLLKHYRGRFSNAVGFQPTGWTHQRDAGQTRARGRRRQKGTIITYQASSGGAEGQQPHYHWYGGLA